MSSMVCGFQAFDRAAPPRVTHVTHAHWNIACGIYDPHLARIAALTALRIVQLIQGLQKRRRPE